MRRRHSDFKRIRRGQDARGQEFSSCGSPGVAGVQEPRESRSGSTMAMASESGSDSNATIDQFQIREDE